RDLWFAGFTPDLVAVVWVGYDEPRPMRHAAASIALPIWRRFLAAATGKHVPGAFPRPPSVRVAEIDPLTGALALDGCPRRQPEYFVVGTEPEATCPERRFPFPFFARGDDDDEREPRREARPHDREGDDVGRAFGRFLGRLFGR